MNALDTIAAEQAHDLRLPVRRLALATGAGCVAAQALALTSGGGEHAPWSLVLAQQLWNAAEVGLLLTLLCLWRGGSRWALPLGMLTVAALPFALYVTSPGAWMLTVLMLGLCALARHEPTLGVSVSDVPPKGGQPVRDLGVRCLHLQPALLDVQLHERADGLVPIIARSCG